MNKSLTSAGLLLAAFATMGDSCDGPGQQAARDEAAQQGAAYRNILRNQPPPTFDFSMERKIMIALYEARQHSVATYSYVQSNYTGKVLWSCPSLGYPIPYSTQLTNPSMPADYAHGAVTLSQPEPNGLFPPPSSEATWVPCVDANGNITPVYEEKRVTVFLQQMQETNGTLTPVAGSTASLTIKKQ
jgi:hypothetical protein